MKLGNARLLTMTGDGHTAYDGYPADGFNSACADRAIEAYLFDRSVPPPGTRCAQDWPDFTTPAEGQQLRARAGSKVVIAPRTRPLRLP